MPTSRCRATASPEQIDAAVRQLVSKAITTDGQVIDVFTAAGLPKPDISILSDGFLAEVRGLKHKNVAAELLEKLLKNELKVRSKRNLVQSQLFSEKLKKTLNAYHNRAISTMEVIEELIRLAKEMDAATKRGVDLGLTDDEVAFYDALAANESAVKAMGDDKLKVIAAELITQVRKSVTIDWTLREGARAKIRVMVKRILNKYGYPPDLQEEAVKTVLQQAELLCAEWAQNQGRGADSRGIWRLSVRAARRKLAPCCLGNGGRWPAKSPGGPGTLNGLSRRPGSPGISAFGRRPGCWACPPSRCGTGSGSGIWPGAVPAARSNGRPWSSWCTGWRRRPTSSRRIAPRAFIRGAGVRGRFRSWPRRGSTGRRGARHSGRWSWPGWPGVIPPW